MLKYILTLIVVLITWLSIVFPAKAPSTPPVHTASLLCLTDNIWYESRGEGKVGMQLVAEVTINRSIHSGKSICEVIYSKAQFSWTNKSHTKLRKSTAERFVQPSYRVAKDIAYKTIQGHSDRFLPRTARWYHSHKVKPIWRHELQKVAEVNRHIFYTK